MANNQDASELLEAEQNLKIIRIQEIFKNITNQITLAEGQEIVAFFGPTKAGKSTLINILMNNPLKCIQDLETEETSIVCVDPSRGPTIGTSGQSETCVPKGYSHLPGTEWVMWDFPGLGDNKGTEQEIANAAAYEKVLRPQTSVRFVLVVPIDLIKSDNPMQFFKLLSDILLICPNVEKSLCLVATKSVKGSLAGFLKRVVGSEFLGANIENSKIINNGKHVAKKLLDNHLYVDFKAPVMGDEQTEAEFQVPNQNEIIDVIKKLKGASVADFPLVISDQAKHDILLLYTVFYQTMRREIEQTCNSLDNFVQQRIDEIQQSTEDDGRPTSSATKLALFRQGKNSFTAIRNKCDNFSTFIIQIQRFGFPIETLSSGIEKFVFIEKIKNMYKAEKERDGQGENEFFYSVQMVLNLCAQKYSDLIRNSEAATAEEKRLESEWLREQAQEYERLTDELEQLRNRNNSVLENIAEFISDPRVLSFVNSAVEAAVKAVTVFKLMKA